MGEQRPHRCAAEDSAAQSNSQKNAQRDGSERVPFAGEAKRQKP